MRTKTRFLAFGLVLILLAGLAASTAAGNPGPATHDIRPGPGVSQVVWLSKYFPALAGTPGDTRVYILKGARPGPTALVLGGTHGNEISGIMTATMMVERASVEAGRLIVIPRANNSASTHSDPGMPSYIELKTPSGIRRFAYGSRLTNPAHQETDPDEYQHFQTNYSYPGEEIRNLDRSYPGRPDGTLTQQIAYGIFQVIEQEKPGIAIDLHEAGPSSRLAYLMIANPKCIDTAALAAVDLGMAGITIQIDQSSNQRGLSHREWGDLTPAQAFIIETANPGQSPNAKNPDVVNDKTNPLWLRMGVHVTATLQLFRSFDEMGGGSIVLSNLPSLEDLKENGIGTYFN